MRSNCCKSVQLILKGERLVAHARGRDLTVLFETVAVLSAKLNSMEILWLQAIEFNQALLRRTLVRHQTNGLLYAIRRQS
jgi:hypothetical protein